MNHLGIKHIHLAGVIVHDLQALNGHLDKEVAHKGTVSQGRAAGFCHPSIGCFSTRVSQ